MQVGVPWIVVRLSVTPQAEGLEDQVAYLFNVGRSASGRYLVEPGELPRHLEARVGLCGNEEGGLVQGNRIIGPRHELLPSRCDIHPNDCTAPPRGHPSLACA